LKFLPLRPFLDVSDCAISEISQAKNAQQNLPAAPCDQHRVTRFHRNPDPAWSSVSGRSETGELAPRNWAKALDRARAIPDGWYRAQSLATVAEHAPEERVLDILNEAVKAADACHDEYGMVAVRSWPLQVAFKRGRISFAERERERAIELAASVQPLASRAYAMQCLWGGCYAADPRHAKPVWEAIRSLCHPDRSWRAARLYRHIADIRAYYENKGAAHTVILAMPEGKARAKLARRFGLAADEKAPKGLQ
jgi:hypothetical protein